MKFTLFFVLACATLVIARPDSVINLDLDDIHLDQDIADGSVVTGSYTWTSPEGQQFTVNYVADEDGYRVLDSNAVPVSADGVRVDGQQGSFVSLEDLIDDLN